LILTRDEIHKKNIQIEKGLKELEKGRRKMKGIVK
jgi:hypothetical protein